MKRTILLMLVAALVGPVAVGPGNAAAQSGLELRIAPKAGLMTPADWFYVEYSHYGLEPTEWTETSILKTAVVGLTVELEFPGTDVWIRGEGLRTVDGVALMTHKVLYGPTGFEPPREVVTGYRVAMAVTTGTIDLAFPTRLTLGPVQPYVTAGVGATRYDFDTAPFQDLPGEVVLPQPGVVPAANVGVGAIVTISGLAFDVQVRDALSEYWGRLQHNMMFMGGLSWSLF
ncbi:MAG: hypothetical protein R6U63_10100 [Longimicrobiales bacterium]